MNSKEAIGNRIYQARVHKGLKQIEVCKAVGISQSKYSNIENGKYDIPLSVLLLLSDLFDVSITWIAGVDDLSEFTSSEQLEIEKFKKFLLSKRF